MPTIRTTEELAAFCAEARTKPYVTIDTEFLRERTYYSKLIRWQRGCRSNLSMTCSAMRAR